MEDIYFMEQGGDGRVFYSGSRSTTILLTAIGILVLLSGVINFANFFTSLAPVRIRSINTQKVVGAPTRALRWMLTMETAVIALIALIISFLLAGWISQMLVSANILKGLFTAHSIGILPDCIRAGTPPHLPRHWCSREISASRRADARSAT